LPEFISELVLSKERLDSRFTCLTPENASLHALDKRNNNTKHTSEIKHVDSNSHRYEQKWKYQVVVEVDA
jgi:hypothetical protein